MKVFISQPMSSRTDEEVFEMRRRLKHHMILHCLNKYKPEDIEFLSTYDDQYNLNLTKEDLEGKKENIFRLGHAIQLLAEADFVIFAPDFYTSRGCKTEYKICNLYNIPFYVASNLNGENNESQINKN